jgi:hypothetical protein
LLRQAAHMPRAGADGRSLASAPGRLCACSLRSDR